MTIARYVLATCRPQTRTVFDEAGDVRPDRLAANVAEHCALIARAARDHGARLIVFPEFSLTGHAMISNDQWVAASIGFPGPELARIGDAAAAVNAYVVVQAAERHPAFPGRYFLSAAIVTPQGDVGLVYRKHYTLSLRTSPIDVHDAFVTAFGRDAFYPVLDTPIGRIGIIIGAEAHWPEATRSLALNGAEIVVNPIANVTTLDYLNRAGADAVRGVRAFENMTYFAMANMASAPDTPPSRIYDYEGRAIGTASDVDALFTLATIDLAALRAARAASGANLLAQIQPAIHADIHALPLWPRNAFADHPAPSFADAVAVEQAAWGRMAALGQAVLPAGDPPA